MGLRFGLDFIRASTENVKITTTHCSWLQAKIPVMRITKDNNKLVRIGTIGKGGQGERLYSINGKSCTLSANGGGRGAKTGLYLIDDEVRKPQSIRSGEASNIAR